MRARFGLSLLLRLSAVCAVVSMASPVGATRESGPPCWVLPLAPRPAPTGSDPVEIPANAAALAFGVDPIDSLTSLGVKSTTGAVVATTRESWPGAIVLRLGDRLVAGSTYFVDPSMACAPGGAPREAVRFRAGPAAALPKSFGKLVQTTVTLPATTQPSWYPSLELEPTDEASTWMALTRFRVQVPGSPDRVLDSPYGGSGSGVPVTRVKLVNLGAFCATPRVTTLEVSATLAGESAPYATSQIEVDTSTYCDELARSAEALERASSSSNTASADEGGGCSVSSAPHATSSVGGVAALALALAAPFVRRRRAARAS